MHRIDLNQQLSLSRLVYGMWRIGDDADTSPGHIQAKIETCLDVGITSLDQADIYGGYEAEALLGASFQQAPGLRDKVELITKCDIVAPVGRYSDARVKYYDTSAAHITQSVEHSLRLMATDRIDLLLIHRPDPLMDAAETGAALDALIASGKVLNVGVSNFRPYDMSLLQSAMTNRLATNQIEINPFAHDAFTNGDIAYLQERGIHPMAWSPLGGGALFGTDPTPLRVGLQALAERLTTDVANLVLAWLMHHPSGILPVLGTNRLDRIRASADAVNVPMDRQTWFEIYTLALGREVA